MKVQEIFDQAIGSMPPSGVDVDRVIRRQRRSTRLRSGVAVLAGVMALAIATGAGTQVIGGGEGTGPPLGIPPNQDPFSDGLAGFPEYAQGFRVLAGDHGSLGEPTLTVDIIPSVLDLAVFMQCETPGLDPGYAPYVEIRLGGTLVDADAPCQTSGTSVRWDLLEPAEGWAAAGVAAAEPVTVTVTVTEIRHGWDGGAEEVAVPDNGSIRVAVAERVPFDDYPLPEPPARLESLPEPGSGIVMRADPADPGQPVETTTIWDSDLAGCDTGASGVSYALNLVSQTPGTLRVLVDGVVAITHTWWDYEQAVSVADLSEVCERVTDGEEVAIRVEPEHVTGDWWVTLGGDG